MLDNKDYKFFEKARYLALASDHYKTRVGAILVKKNKIISYGINSNIKSHPLQKYYNDNYRGFKEDNCRHLIHAELQCVLNAGSITGSNSIYIVRIDRKNNYCGGKPCNSCLAMLRDFNILDIYYSTENGYAYERIRSL